MKTLLSACLCGIPCRYDGVSQPNPRAVEWVASGEGVPFCPETAGGLPCPRVPAEIQGGDGKAVLEGKARVVTRDGRDVTQAYIAGAKAAVALCRGRGITRAYLKTRSPSCGTEEIYDGHFRGRLRAGSGVAAQALREAGIQVFPMEKGDQL